jgi:2-succinyl-5-enolpyruvyl-6-hydroxy-3-cyclohexene-1-carboxylate synthase
MSGADVNLNALWARLIVEELYRGGVRTAVLCPGSRNSPLLFAFARMEGMRVLSHTDERSAGFIALGVAKGGGEPAAVCVTSGSALANLLPAVVEAHATHLPLVVVAADRPWEMHANGSAQAMPQRGIFADFIAGELDLGEPTATPAALRALRAQVSRLAQRRGGPVVINVPLRDPLPPLPDPAWQAPELPADVRVGRAGGAPFTEMENVGGGVAVPARWTWLRPGLAGVIVVGPADQQHPAAVMALARATGFPLVADAVGGLRAVGDVPGAVNLVACADALLGGELGGVRAELVIQVGAAPLARAVYEWLGRQECPWVAIEAGRNQDMLGRAWGVLDPADDATYGALAARLAPGDAAWASRWRAAEEAARARWAAADEPWGEVSAAQMCCRDGRFRFRHLASSMAVRHGNVHIQPGPAAAEVFANRGVSGIDGTIGTFIGLAWSGLAMPGMLLCGDLAFLHDLPALATARMEGLRGAIVVLNNDGGGIFDYLPVAQVDGYRPWVRTPHGADLAAAAAQAGLSYRAVESRAALAAALDAAATGPGMVVIECRVAGGDAVGRHRALLQSMAGPEGA